MHAVGYQRHALHHSPQTSPREDHSYKQVKNNRFVRYDFSDQVLQNGSYNTQQKTPSPIRECEQDENSEQRYCYLYLQRILPRFDISCDLNSVVTSADRAPTRVTRNPSLRGE